MEADMVLPPLDAWDEDTFRKIDRPYGRLRFGKTVDALAAFSQRYPGQLWLELMLVEGVNSEGPPRTSVPCSSASVTTVCTSIPRCALRRRRASCPSLREKLRRLSEKLGGISIDSPDLRRLCQRGGGRL